MTKDRGKTLQNFLAGGEKPEMKATKTLLSLNENVQKLATAHDNPNNSVHKHAAIRLTIHC
jgi:hypothetical protein